MTTETITRIKLTANEGMVLTDGTTYGKIIYLAQSADWTRFYEISDADYALIQEAEAKKNENI